MANRADGGRGSPANGRFAGPVPVVRPLNINRTERRLDAADDVAIALRNAVASKDIPNENDFNLTTTLQNITTNTSTSAQDILLPLQMVISSLEALTKIHPFVAVAVLPFKAIVTLELKRRENDRRILALISQMADMMNCLRDLPKASIKSHEESTLEELLFSIQGQITQCGNAIDVYYKTKLIVKIIKSTDWQNKVELYAQSFAGLKDELRMKLLLIIHNTAGNTNSVVTNTDAKIDQLLILLRRKTQFESELLEFIRRSGGMSNSVGNDEFMGKLVKKFEGVGEELGPQIFNDQSAPVPSSETKPPSGPSPYPPFSIPQPQLQPQPFSTNPLDPYSYSSPPPFSSPPSQLSPPPSYSAAAATGYGPMSPPSLISAYARQVHQSASSAQPFSSVYHRPSTFSWQPSTIPNYHYPVRTVPTSSFSYDYVTPPRRQDSISSDALGPAQWRSVKGRVPTPGPGGKLRDSDPGYERVEADASSVVDDPPFRPLPNSNSADDTYPNIYSRTTAPPTSPPTYLPPTGSQASTPYGIQRTSIRTSVATRPPEDEVFETAPVDTTARDYSYTSQVQVRVKPGLIEAYRVEINYALRTDLGQMLEKNLTIWTFKLDHMTNELKAHIDKSTFLILQALTQSRHISSKDEGKGKEGPHSRISDPELRSIWFAEKWRGSVPASAFFQALQDYFLEEDEVMKAEERGEGWALEGAFLGMGWRAALEGVVDRDGSGYVSIGEVNRWSGGKPEGMSLLVWTACSACLWAWRANESHKAILNHWSTIIDFFLDPPTGRTLATAPSAPFLEFQQTIMPDIQQLLSSLLISQRRIAEIKQYGKFVRVLGEMSERMKGEIERGLEGVGWVVDDGVVLKAIVGSGGIENSLLTLLELLIADYSSHLTPGPLGPRFLQEAYARNNTLAQVLAAVDERVFYLRDCFPPEKIAVFRYGLFASWVPKEVPVESALPRFEETDEDEDVEVEVPETANLNGALSPVLEDPSPIPLAPTPLAPVPAQSPVHELGVDIPLPHSRPDSGITNPAAPPTPISLYTNPPLSTSSLPPAMHVSSPTPSTPISLGPSVTTNITTPIATIGSDPVVTGMPSMVSIPSLAPPPILQEPVVPAAPPPTEEVPFVEPDLENVMAPLFYVEAQYSYRGAEDSDMDLEPGDRIAVLDTPESGWWVGRQLTAERDIPGKTIFPSNYVALCGLD